MIVYVSEFRPDLLDEVCGNLYMIVTKIRQSNLKKLVIGSAADFSHAGRFVIDLSAPSGYLKATESKDVYLEAGKTVEIKLDNRLRPALRVYKTGSGTGLPLVSAKFRVQKTEDSTVSEYVTDSGGRIICSSLYKILITF